MAKIQPTKKTSKLTVVGHAELGKLITKYPSIAKILEDEQRASMLDRLLQGTKLLDIEKEVSIKLKEVVQRLDCLTQMEAIVGRKPASTLLGETTAARLVRDNPTLGDHMMKFLGDAVGYDELLRQLITHHNFESIEAGDINDLIYQVEDLRTSFRELAAIHAAQHRAPKSEDRTHESKAA